MFSVGVWIIKGVVDLKRNILSFTRHQVVPNLYFFHKRNIFMQVWNNLRLIKKQNVPF